MAATSTKKSVKKTTKKQTKKASKKVTAKNLDTKSPIARNSDMQDDTVHDNPVKNPAEKQEIQKQEIAERLYQMNVAYDPAEDRLIFRTSTTANREFLFLITNRMFKQIIELSNKIDDVTYGANQHKEESTKQVVREFHREETLKKADFTSKYVAEEVVLTPVFDSPVLLVKIEVQVNDMMLKVILIGKNNSKTVFPMTKENFTALRHILEQGAKQAGWQDPLPEHPTIPEKTATGTIH